MVPAACRDARPLGGRPRALALIAVLAAALAVWSMPAAAAAVSIRTSGAPPSSGEGVRGLPAHTLVVTTAADLPGARCGRTCSLRQAIEASNATLGVRETIVFAIPGRGTRDIVPRSPLPVISDPVTVDGSSQPGIRLVGVVAPTGTHGLHIAASDTVIRGLTIREFPGSGVLVNNVTDVLIGGEAAGEGNVLTENLGDGVTVAGDDAALGNRILGNRIFANGDDAIDLGDDGFSGLSGGDDGDLDAGPNGAQNAPAIAVGVGPISFVDLDVDGRAGVGGARVEVYWAPSCGLGGLAGRPQAEVLVGAAEVALSGAPGAAVGSVRIPLAQPLGGGYLTATATTVDGTSEFASCTHIPTPTDLSVGVAAISRGSGPGSPPTVTFRLTVANRGPMLDPDVTAVLDLGSSTASVVSVTGSQGSCFVTDTSAGCQLGALAPGAGASIEVVALPTSTDPLDVTARVGDNGGLDPDPANNEASLRYAAASLTSPAEGVGPPLILLER